MDMHGVVTTSFNSVKWHRNTREEKKTIRFRELKLTANGKYYNLILLVNIDDQIH